MSSFLPRVDGPKLQSLQLRLESLSKLSVDFLVLLASATLIATFGLFQNSPAVIIGAMIVAPLMRPLVGLSLAALTADTILLLRASITLTVGTIAGVTIAALMALLFSSLELTPEIMGRTQPNLLDLGVAMVAGAVGAYCQTNEKLADTLAGVAIAVALVPPLSVVGIGLAFHAVPVWSGAALLYATNLVGITVAGSLVFLVMGYTPIKYPMKGLAVSAFVVLLLTIPLALSMRELVLENQISATVKKILKEKTFTFRNVQLREVNVKRFRTPMSVTATVLAGDQPITPHQVNLVRDFLAKETGVSIEFRLRIIPSTELTAMEASSEETPVGTKSPTDVETQCQTKIEEKLPSENEQKPVLEQAIDGPQVPSGNIETGPVAPTTGFPPPK